MSEQQEQKSSINFSSFADWCKHKDSLSEAARHTVEVLLKFANTSDIDEANRILSSTTYLPIYNNEISDIAALQSLTNLTYMFLENTQISDITALQSLTNLTSLSLKYNQISDITALQSLTNLTKLSLNGNQISDITALQSLTNLTSLNLENNQISDITALQSLTNFKNLSLDFGLPVNLTTQQKPLIENCRHSLSYFANSTKPLDRPKASTALKVVCEIFGLSTPEITFCRSPQEVLAQLQIQKQIQENYLIDRLEKKVKNALSPFTSIAELQREILREIVWQEQLEKQLINDFRKKEGFHYYRLSLSPVSPKYLLQTLVMAEFCVSCLGIAFKPELQKLFEALKPLLAECGWIFMFEDVFYVCSRPIKLSLDNQYRLHAEGESAIEFADGYKLYSHHGVTLPEKYGAIHPKNWRSQWILEEKNAELRRILIQEIGYARIAIELQATELDCWQEYTLLRIDADIDRFDRADLKEPIHLLKMTCPSTGFIHALRVPPNIASAREAIRWVNWDIAPEDFSVQT